MAFFEVGKTYTIGGYPHTILAVADCLYGPLAWATFPRSNGLDCQTLCQVHFDEAVEIIENDPILCPDCDGDTLEGAEKWDGYIDPPYPVVYCTAADCTFEDEL